MQRAGEGAFDEVALERGLEAGLFAQRERGAHLHPDGSHGTCPGEQAWARISTGQPIGKLQVAELVEVDGIAGPVDGLTLGVEGERATRRSIVAPGYRAFDDEPVRSGTPVAGEITGQYVGSDDGEELRAS